jgi:hypothetical protein
LHVLGEVRQTRPVSILLCWSNQAVT